MTDYGTCEICRNRPARLVVLRRRLDDTNRTFVCPECANERARAYAGESLDFERILNGMRSGGVSEVPSFACRMCGTTMAEVLVDGQPGCCMCYTRFSGEIEQAVENAQGCTRHVGKAPGE